MARATTARADGRADVRADVPARELGEDGRYRRVAPAAGAEAFNSQERLVAHVGGPGLPE